MKEKCRSVRISQLDLNGSDVLPGAWNFSGAAGYNCIVIMLLQYDCRPLPSSFFCFSQNGNSDPVSALSHAAPLVMPPCDTDFPEETKGLRAGFGRQCGFVLCCASPATHGVIDGSSYPLPDGDPVRKFSRRKFYEENKISKTDSFISELALCFELFLRKRFCRRRCGWYEC